MQSLLKKNWTPAPEINSQEDLLKTLLKNRNLSQQEDTTFFREPKLQHLHDPNKIDSMQKAIQRIKKAIKNKERIIIFGDFDADGITSTVILVSALKSLGADISYRIPNRDTDSHGLKTHIIDEIAQTGTTLIITCDCGINDHTEVTHAKNLNIDTIITDHHTPDPKRFPKDATAILNPKQTHCPYPEKDLSGSAIALKLISALFKNQKEQIKKYLEIATIGIISDCVDLTGENRTITQLGLQNLKNTTWKGLQTLLEISNIDPETIDEQHIGFYLAPRLNAASRLGDVKTAVQLFLGEEEANEKRVNQLEQWNNQRRAKTKKAVTEAEQQIKENNPIQILKHENWLPGILGLIASRYSEKLNQPVIAAKLQKDGTVKASCRAPEGHSIINALKSCPQELFEGLGGHHGAAGFSTKIKNLKKIETFLQTHFQAIPKQTPKTKIEAYISQNCLNLETLEQIKRFAPFGPKNPAPIFGLKNAKIQKIYKIGKDKNHLNIQIQTENQTHRLIGFFLGHLKEEIQQTSPINIIFQLNENTWQGKKELQLKIVDIAQSN